MDYVQSLRIDGQEVRLIPCILISGAPTASTVGKVGCFCMDTRSANKDIYKCVSVSGGIYSWEPIFDQEMIQEVLDTLEGKITEVSGKADEAMSVAKGRATGYVFETVDDLDAWLIVQDNVDELILGDNFYIKDLEVPDYWWDGTQKQPLETQKVDLSGYAKSTDIVGKRSTNGAEIFNDYSTNVASGKHSRASGSGNKAKGHASEAGGMNNTVNGGAAHAEGNENLADANCSHVEGHGNKATGYASHSGGRVTEARGHASVALNRGTFASGADQVVSGTYNAIDTMCEDGVTPLPTADDGRPYHQYGGNEYTEKKSQYQRIVGNGTSDADRSNAETLDWKGNHWLAGKSTAKDYQLEGKTGSLASMSGIASAVGAMQNNLGNNTMVVTPKEAGSLVLQENTYYQFLGSSTKKKLKLYNSDNTVSKTLEFQVLTIQCGSMTDNAQFGIEERMSPAYLYVIGNDTGISALTGAETGCYAFKKYLPDSTEINPTFRAEVEYPADSVIVIQTKSTNSPFAVATLEEEV